jgi:hypothetical protein
MAKKSARQVSPREVTGVPTPAGGAPNAGVVKRTVKGGGQVKADKPDSTDDLIVGGNLAPVGRGDGPGVGLEGFGQGGEGRTRS